MFKKFALIGTFIVASVVAGPTKADGGCFLDNGCFYNSDGGGWICSDPVIYMLCRNE